MWLTIITIAEMERGEVMSDHYDRYNGMEELLGTNLAEVGADCISRQQAIDTVKKLSLGETDATRLAMRIGDYLERLPSAQQEKEKAKRVLWTGWKGYRDTRYKCPNCKKPVKNDDIYCHRCGQKLMFPHISFTDYVPGEKQETIVRWDDE
jgi:hypothetical protein